MTDTTTPLRSFNPLPVLLLTGTVYLNFLGRLVFSPLLVPIEAEFNVGHAVTGSFFLIMAIGFSMTMLLSGFVARLIGHRATIQTASLAVVVSTLAIAASPDLLLIQIGLFVLGAGAGLYAPSGIAALTEMVEPTDWGKAIAFHDLGPNLAFISAPFLTNVLLPATSWRGVVATIGVAAAAMLLLFSISSNAGRFKGEPPRFSTVTDLIRQPRFWAVGTFFMLAASATLGVFSILPTYLTVERNFDSSTVNTLVGLSRISGVVMVFVSGILRDRLGERVLIGAVVGVGGVLTILFGVLHGAPLVAVVFLQPAVVTAFFPAALSALSRIGTATSRNVVVSLMIPAANTMGAGVFPAAMGFLGDRGVFYLGFLILGGVMLVSLGLVRYLDPKMHH
jgi:NNP family nitrate/nitrite transporter-like MFS transporter